MLSFSFEELEAALIKLAASPAQRDKVGPIISALRSQLQASGDRLIILDQLLVGVWLILNEDSDGLIEEVKRLYPLH